MATSARAASTSARICSAYPSGFPPAGVSRMRPPSRSKSSAPSEVSSARIRVVTLGWS